MQHEELCKEVERQLQFKPKVRTDFDYLSEKIQAKTHETVSANTLMRLWGYRESVNARRSTLDILARFVGSEDYAHFLKERGLADDEETVEPEEPEEEPTDEVILAAEETEVSTGSLSQGSQNSLNIQITQNNQNTRSVLITLIRAGVLLLFAVVLGFALWHIFLRAPLEEGLPRGAKDMTHLLSNPSFDPDNLDAWTYEHGGVTLSEDSTLMYYMKKFDVYQVVHGLPAGEYELRVKAWQSPDEREAARYAYEQAEDKEDGCACTNAEIYAGPFSKRVKNYVSDESEAERGTLDNALRFVVLDDSVRIGFRSDGNSRRFALAKADDFRLFLIRKAKTEAELKELAALRDSAQAVDAARKPIVTEQFSDWWKGHEAPAPACWLTEQDASCCRLVHKSDVGRGFGDSDIYVEYSSQEPAKHGLLLGQKVLFKPGTYLIGAVFFARDESNAFTNVAFAVKGFNMGFKATPMMEYRAIRITLSEPQELTFGLWAAEGSTVRRAGISVLEILDDYDFENNPRDIIYATN
jgi:hypothetical protein